MVSYLQKLDPDIREDVRRMVNTNSMSLRLLKHFACHHVPRVARAGRTGSRFSVPQKNSWRDQCATSGSQDTQHLSTRRN